MKIQKKVCIAGASGLIGGELLALLCGDKTVEKIFILTRRPFEVEIPPKAEAKVESSLALQRGKIKQVICDFSQLGKIASEIEAEEFYCCLGTTIKKAGSEEAFKKVDLEFVLEFAKFAKTKNAKYFSVVSALGADAHSSVFYNRVKGEMQEALKSLGLNKCLVLQPSLLVGDRKESRPLEKLSIQIFGGLSFALVGPMKRFAPVAAKQVAKVMTEGAHQNFKGYKVIVNLEILNWPTQ